MVDVFDYLQSLVLHHNAPLNNFSYETVEGSFQLADRRLTKQIKSLNISGVKFLIDKDYKTFFKLKQNVLKLQTNNFNKLYADLIEAAGPDRQKLQIINKIRD